MWKTKLTVVISSVLLASAMAQADPQVESEKEKAQGSDNVDVGAKRSNVDERSSSGSYYPNSAGTVGDSPAKPTETSIDASEVAKDEATKDTDQWTVADSDGDGYLTHDELAKASPTSAASFKDMDVDGDKKLTRDEFRTWDESRKASMDADKAPNPGFSSSRDAEASAPAGSSSAPVDASSAPASTSSAPDESTSSSRVPSGTDN